MEAKVNKQLACPFFIWLFSLSIAISSLASEPKLIRSIPADGAQNVSLQQGKIVLYFDQNMKMNSWSLMQTASYPFPPMKPLEEPWRDPLTFELEIKELQPNTVYSLQLNSKKKRGFCTATSQEPLPITTITFSTGSDSAQHFETKDHKADVANQDVPQEEIKIPSRPEPIGPVAGWKFDVTRSTGMKGTENYQNGFQAPFRFFQKVAFQQTVTRIEPGWILEADRRVTSAQLHSLNPQTGQMMPQDLVPANTSFHVSHTPQGSTLIDSKSGQQVWDENMLAAFATPLQPRLWPDGELKQGQKWSYQDADLKSRIALLDVLGGRIDLAVEKIAPEPCTGIMTATIRGKLKTKVDLDAVILDFDAEVSIELPIQINIPFMVKFEGNLSGNGSVVNEMGQNVIYRIEAQGSLLQIAKPESKILGDFDKTDVIMEKGKIGPNGAIIIPLGKEDYDAKNHQQSRSQKPVYNYRLYEDVTEKAFTVLVPEGWQTEGGIMRIDPSQIRTVVDGCGKKLYFSIHDPQTQASITYFPTEMYGTTYGPSIAQPGQVLNGMVQMPQLLSPSVYVQQIVFPQARPRATNIKWGEVKSLQTLADAWNKAFHSEDSVPAHIVAESIEVAYDQNGTRFAELWTSLITSVSVSNTSIWMPDFTVVAGAPQSVVEKLAPILKAVITSFSMNPNWMARAIVNFDACTKGVAAAQDKIRDLDRKISEQSRKVQQQIHDIDNEIVANHDQTRSVIQEHEHNTLMGVDKYEDSESGTRYLIDMGYDRNFTNGEQIIQTNDWNYTPPSGYREMKNIHITDE
jgi:hypothetical protein